MGENPLERSWASNFMNGPEPFLKEWPSQVYDSRSMQQGKRSNFLQFRRQRWLIVGAVALLVCIGIGTAILVHSGPLTRESVAQDLGQRLGGEVTIGRFHSRYLPYPTCVAEDVAVSQSRGGKVLLITITKLTIAPGFSALLTSRIDEVRADGLRVEVPAVGS